MKKNKKFYFIRKLAEILMNPVKGKIFGGILILIPALFFLIYLRNIKLNYLLIYLLCLIPVTYLGLFMGGYFHELGHVFTLRLMGCKCKVKVLKNDHSKLIFFNMKTEILNDHPINSTTDRLILRAISGMMSNIIFSISFMLAGFYFKNIVLFYMALIQGFSGHGATALASLDGDTDVNTLRKALLIRDILNIDCMSINGDSKFDININIKLKDTLSDSYWLIIDNKNIRDVRGDFISFDIGNSMIFIIPEAREGFFHLSFTVSEYNSITVITKTGKKILCQNDFEEAM
ncbi:hypothetical protein IAI10_11825 [Clostridium sp. 19966]|uniref:hypothetical protein n=1 Tax=Clostridium sp. 19966 TaxID=2768166 RepID=UPI0028DF824D|nr:hypothetical protein [Clostridium sp. 19966]MDT8717349.1 hypothetical protein [Clostridium sp. 19966]